MARFSMKSSDWTTTGGMSSNLAYARPGWGEVNSGLPRQSRMRSPACGFSR
jgi:hypothetical protein